MCLSREAEKQRREPAAASKSAPPDAKLGSKARETRRKWDPTQPRRVGPVYVQILDQVPPPSASGERPCVLLHCSVVLIASFYLQLDFRVLSLKARMLRIM